MPEVNFTDMIEKVGFQNSAGELSFRVTPASPLGVGGTKVPRHEA